MVKDVCTFSKETQNDCYDVNNVNELEELKERIQKELQELEDSPENVMDFIDLTVMNETNSQIDINEKDTRPVISRVLKSQDCYVQKSKSTLMKNKTIKLQFEGYYENKLPSTTLESGSSCCKVNTENSLTFKSSFSENLNDNSEQSNIKQDLFESKSLDQNEAEINSSPIKNNLSMLNKSIVGQHGIVSISGNDPFPAKTKSGPNSQGEISEITTSNNSRLEQNKISGRIERKVVIESNNLANCSDKKTVHFNINLADLVEWVHKRLNINKPATIEAISKEHTKCSFHISRLGRLDALRRDQRRELQKHRKKVAFFSALMTSHLPMLKYVTCKFIENPTFVKLSAVELHKYFTCEDFENNVCKNVDESIKMKENSHHVGVETITSGSFVRDENLEKNICMSINYEKGSTLSNSDNRYFSKGVDQPTTLVEISQNAAENGKYEEIEVSGCLKENNITTASCVKVNLENALSLNSSYSATNTNCGLEKSNNKNVEILIKLKDWVTEKISWNWIPSLSLLHNDMSGIENLLMRLDTHKNDLLYKDLSIFQKIEKQQELRQKLVNLQLFKHILETQPEILDRLVSEITSINELSRIKCLDGSKINADSKDIETSTKSKETQNAVLHTPVSKLSLESKLVDKNETNPRKDIESSKKKRDLLNILNESVDCQQGNISFSSNDASSSKTKSGTIPNVGISEITSSNNRLEEIKVSGLGESKATIELNNPANFQDDKTIPGSTNLDDLVKWVHKRLNINKPTTIETISKEHTKSSFHISRLGVLASLRNDQRRELIKHRRKISLFSTLLTSHLPMFKYIIGKFTEHPMLIKSSIENVQKHFSHKEFEEYCLNSEQESNRTNTQPQHVNIKDNTADPGTSKVNTTNISHGSDQDNVSSVIVSEHVKNNQKINSIKNSKDSRPPNELLLIFLDNWVQKQVINKTPITIQQLNHNINHLNEYCKSKSKHITMNVRKILKRYRSLAELLSFAKQLVELNPSILEPIAAKYKAKLELIKLSTRQLDNQSLSLYYKWLSTNKKDPFQENSQSKPSGFCEVVCGQSNINVTSQDMNSKQEHVNTNNCPNIESRTNHFNTNVPPNHLKHSFETFKPKSNFVETKEIGYHRLTAADSAVMMENDTSRGIQVDDSNNKLKRQNAHMDSPLNATHLFKDNFLLTHEMSFNSENLSPSKRIKIGDFPVKCAPNIEVPAVEPLSPAYSMHSHSGNNSVQKESVISDRRLSRLTIQSESRLAGGSNLYLNPKEKTDLKTGLIQTRPQSSLEISKLTQSTEPNVTPFASQLQQMHMFLPTPTVQCCSNEFLEYYPHLKISDVLENITKRNPGLNCERWRVYREWKDELNCYNYSLGVDEKSIRFLLSQGNRARVTFKYYALFQKIQNA